MHALEDLFPLYVKHVLRSRLHEHESSPFRDIALIQAEGPASIYWDHEPQSWDWSHDLGVLSPLFDSMWIEARPHIPLSRLRQDLTPRAVSMIEAQRAAQRLSRVTDISSRRKVAIHIKASDGRNQREPTYLEPEKLQEWREFYTSDARWKYDIEVYVETDRGFSSSIESKITALIDDDGSLIKKGTDSLRGYRAPGQLSITHAKSDSITSPVDLTPFLLDAVFFAFYSLSLANAKNVGVIDESGSIQSKDIRKAISMSDAVPASFSRINLNAVSSPAASDESSSGESSRVHFVRGHFKTYTEESKLMGKHVGTYYWAHHARGDQTQGEIDQVYGV